MGSGKTLFTRLEKSNWGTTLNNVVRERMLNCVIKDVRSRFPNPPGIAYMGHKRE